MTALTSSKSSAVMTFAGGDGICASDGPAPPLWASLGPATVLAGKGEVRIGPELDRSPAASTKHMRLIYRQMSYHSESQADLATRSVSSPLRSLISFGNRSML